jgi:cell division transport system permease protein
MKTLTKEKETNPYIQDIWYFKDVVDRIKTISVAINYGGIAMIAALGVITFALIMITIGFNILAHKNEIEIMHLVGSTDNFIKAPFIMEGSYYGFMGGLISSIILVVPWVLIVSSTRDSEFFVTLAAQMRNMDLAFLVDLQPAYVALFMIAQVFAGFVLGAIGSASAVLRYLKLEEK